MIIKLFSNCPDNLLENSEAEDIIWCYFNLLLNEMPTVNPFAHIKCLLEFKLMIIKDYLLSNLPLERLFVS